MNKNYSSLDYLLEKLGIPLTEDMLHKMLEIAKKRDEMRQKNKAEFKEKLAGFLIQKNIPVSDPDKVEAAAKKKYDPKVKQQMIDKEKKRNEFKERLKNELKKRNIPVD